MTAARLVEKSTGWAGAATAVAALVFFAASLFDLVPFDTANLLLASGGAMALGLILVAVALFARVQESREARSLDAQFLMAGREVNDALEASDRLEARIAASGLRGKASAI